VSQKLNDFSISPGSNPFHVAAYIPGGNQPANVRIYRYPEFQNPVANKTFFKADSVSMTWNKRGNALIVMALTEVDSTGKSYYGETNLYLALTNGDSFLLPMAKPGPVYSVDWHPNSSEFCVVYGYMPAKATLYNLKGEPLFDFGTGPRNEVYYNPRGDIICICGFGNLRGNVEFWSPTSKNAQQQKQKRDLTRVAHFNAEDTTLFRWAPNGRHFASATTAPRLRVNNGYKLWNCAGQPVFEYKVPNEQEMWEVAWRPVPISAFPDAAVIGNPNQVAVGGGVKGAPQEKAQPAAYVPPHLRGQTNRPQFKLHEEEPASNVKDQQEAEEANLSKAALKNRKKREAAKKTQEPSASAKPGAIPSAIAAGGSNNSKALDIVNSDAETQKKVKGILKKLEQINVLKQKMVAGEKLEANQVEKIQKEEELLRELEDLQLD
jgi:translation initiation factor 2A